MAGSLAVYMCANATILEFYGGNPDLGIASYTQVVSRTADKETLNRGSTDPMDREAGSCDDGDDCFVTCSHAFQAASCVVAEIRSIPLVKSDPNFSLKNLRSDWHRPLLYRPPRIS